MHPQNILLKEKSQLVERIRGDRLPYLQSAAQGVAIELVHKVVYVVTESVV